MSVVALLAGGLMLCLLAWPVPFGPEPHGGAAAQPPAERERPAAPAAPAAPATAAAPAASHRTAASPAPPPRVHINTATLAELDSLPGIGPSKAEAIIAARVRRPFRRLSDLLRVPGIGRATLARLAPLLAFDLPPPTANDVSRPPTARAMAPRREGE